MTDKPAKAKRPTLSRHPKAVAARHAKKGGAGVSKPPGPHTHIDSPTSQNPSQKGLASLTAFVQEVLVQRDAGILAGPGGLHDDLPNEVGMVEPPPSFAPVVDKGNPWGDNSFRAAIYARPFNPRLLLVVFSSGTHGRLVVGQSDRVRFSIGAEVWVKPAGGSDLYVLAGAYNRFGKRCK